VHVHDDQIHLGSRVTPVPNSWYLGFGSVALEYMFCPEGSKLFRLIRFHGINSDRNG
jgi:hypothetical protein